MAVISSMNKWQGYTVGASRMVSHVAGSLSKHRKIIHEVISKASHTCRALYLLACRLCSPLNKVKAEARMLNELNRGTCKGVLVGPWL